MNPAAPVTSTTSSATVDSAPVDISDILEIARRARTLATSSGARSEQPSRTRLTDALPQPPLLDARQAVGEVRVELVRLVRIELAVEEALDALREVRAVRGCVPDPG
jgi:hypothetical protein